MDKYTHGTFCWPELMAGDWTKAKEFYCALFDWQPQDQEIGPDCYYTMLQKDGLDIGAMYQMMPEHQEQGMKTNWLSYIAVDSVDEVVAKAKQLGAEIVAGPHHVHDAGRMAMILEPQGAMFAIWQANKHNGAGVVNQPHSMCWNELASKNTDKSSDFYTQLFGWQPLEKNTVGMKYTEFSVAGIPNSGMLQMTEEWGDLPPHWMIYFAVDDCDAYATKAQGLGATLCVPPTDIPEVGRFAVINDSQGATFSIIKLLPQL
ncbi:MAG: VOC family protein [Gammaproteobacteria bacterium]|nr:VOC family protein [Gammaproteobacteria bacterium]